MELDGKKERPKLNHLPSSPAFFPGSPPLLTSASFHQQLTGDTQWGQWSVDLSPSFLFTAFPCSSVGSSHGLQSLRINVSALGPSQPIIPARKSAPAWTPVHRLQFPLGHMHLFWHGVLHVLQCGYLLRFGLLHGLEESSSVVLKENAHCSPVDFFNY